MSNQHTVKAQVLAMAIAADVERQGVYEAHFLTVCAAVAKDASLLSKPMPELDSVGHSKLDEIVERHQKAIATKILECANMETIAELAASFAIQYASARRYGRANAEKAVSLGERLAQKNCDVQAMREERPQIAKRARSNVARKGAFAKHRETREMKAKIFVWLDGNMPNFTSMDAAAEAITKQEPIKFRTARDWVGEWKKLRSAGKP